MIICSKLDLRYTTLEGLNVEKDPTGIIYNWSDNVVNKVFWYGDQRKFLNFTNEEMVKYIVGRGSKRTADRIEKEVAKQIRDVSFNLGLGGVSTQSHLNSTKKNNDIFKINVKK